MNVAIFGATGGTGRQLVEQALARGHAVTALVRDAGKLDGDQPRLRIMTGDVQQPADVERAVQGQDAVICALGAPARKSGRIRSEGTRNIVQAMEKTGVRRLVCQTSLGYGDTRQVLDRSSFFFRYVVVPLFLRDVFEDHQRQEEVVKHSRLDWIIVRPGNLTDGPYTGNYRHGFAATDPAIKVEVSRADVADFMLKQLKDDTYLRRATGISY